MACTAGVSLLGTTQISLCSSQALYCESEVSIHRFSNPSRRSEASLSSLSSLCGLCLSITSLKTSKRECRGVQNARAQESGRNATVVRSDAPEKQVNLRPGRGGNIVESQNGAFVVYPPTIPVKRRVGRSIMPSERKKKDSGVVKPDTDGSEKGVDVEYLEKKESKLAEKRAKQKAREGYFEDEEEEAVVLSGGKDLEVVTPPANQDSEVEEYFRGKADVRLDYDIRPVVDRIRSEGLEVMALFVDKLGVRDMDRILLKFGAKEEWQLALQVFVWMLKDRYLQPDQKTYTIMMDILGTNRQPQLAEEMFQSMQEEGLVDTRACNVLLNAYAQVGQAKQAAALFAYMKEQGMRLDAYTYSSVIKSLSRDKSRTDELLGLFDEMQAARIAPTSVVYTQMIEALGSAGLIDQAESMFKQMKRTGVTPELIAYNSLMAAYARHTMINKVEALFEELQEEGFEPSKHTYCTVINAYGNAGQLESAERVFQDYLASPQVQDPAPHNAMMGVYARRGDLTKALQVFVGMNERGAFSNVVSAVIILSSLVRARKVDEAEQLYETIKALEIPHSTQLWNAVIHMYKSAGKLDKARAAYAAMIEGGCRPNDVTFRELAALDKLEKNASASRPVNGTPVARFQQPALLDAVEEAVHRGSLREALEVLRAALKDTKGDVDLQAFHVFFKACERTQEWEAVEELYGEMQRRGLRLSSTTYLGVLQVYARANQMPKAEAVYAEMREKGMGSSANVYNIRAHGYGRVRNFEKMETVFGEMQTSGVAPNEVTFNTLISHYARTQQYDVALDALQRMYDAGLSPNDVTLGIFKRYCNVSYDQLQAALRQGTFDGIISDDEFARQRKGRRPPRRENRPARVNEDGDSSASRGSSNGRSDERTGLESLVEDQPSSSSAAGDEEWFRTLLHSSEAPSEVYDTVRWAKPETPLGPADLAAEAKQLVDSEGLSLKPTALNNVLFSYADNLHMRGALRIFDKMVEKNIPLKKRSANKLLENLARTRHTDDLLRVRKVCEKARIANFIYVSEAVERELNRAGRVTTQPL